MSESPIEPARRAAQQYAEQPGSDLIERIAERLGGSARATAVFGTPVEREGVTVIPVARVRLGFGAGGGAGRGDTEGSGSGGGGGASASPAGYIELRDGKATFQRIRGTPPLWVIPLIVLAGGIAIAEILRSVRMIVRRK